MTEELDLLKEVASRLTAAGIEYMVTGSTAMMVYAAPRATRDVDIVINVIPGDIAKIMEIFQSDFYIDSARVDEAVGNRGMFNIIHNESVIKFDFIVRKDDEYRILELARKQRIEIEGVPVYFVSPEDLVLSKLLWAKESLSELQIRDVQQILASLPGIDQAYLKEWADRLGVTDLLERVQTDA